MTELLMKVFRPKAYWQEELNRCHDLLLSAEFQWREAIKKHRKSKHLQFQYQLARLNYEKAWAGLQKAKGE